MKIVGVIPARYASSRLPGKPLVDICGKPMIWWVYQQCLKIREFDTVYVATDDKRIESACAAMSIPALMTNPDHPTHVHRIREVSERVAADYYVVVCGDEPLITAEVIRSILPEQTTGGMYVGGLCRYFEEASEVLDPGNIKVVVNENEECIMLSRAPVPHPYKTVLFKYKKVVGVECYNKQALDFFCSTKKGFLESIEDVTLQRFLENKIHVKYRLVETDSISVDTERDLEKVRLMMKERNHVAGS